MISTYGVPSTLLGHEYTYCLPCKRAAAAIIQIQTKVDTLNSALFLYISYIPLAIHHPLSAITANSTEYTQPHNHTTHSPSIHQLHLTSRAFHRDAKLYPSCIDRSPTPPVVSYSVISQHDLIPHCWALSQLLSVISSGISFAWR